MNEPRTYELRWPVGQQVPGAWLCPVLQHQGHRYSRSPLASTWVPVSNPRTSCLCSGHFAICLLVLSCVLIACMTCGCSEWNPVPLEEEQLYTAVSPAPNAVLVNAPCLMFKGSCYMGKEQPSHWGEWDSTMGLWVFEKFSGKAYWHSTCLSCMKS